jgi:hypothetical protein
MSANSTVRPELADVYFDWEAEDNPSPPASQGGIVAVAATSDWGPVNTPTLFDTYDDYVALHGGSDTDLRRAVFGAFKGQGVNGRGGAGQVLAYRQATASAAKATKTLQNTGAANALVLTAKYNGTRANNLRITVQAGTVVGTNDLLILDGALVVEKYTHTTTDIATLAANINALSDWFTATMLVTGVALAAVSALAATGGNDGATLLTADWTATFAALDTVRWNIFPAYNLTDPTIRASIVAWIQQRNSLGSRCFAVFGGAAGESLATAQSRSQAINDFNIINLGEGTLHLTDQNRDVSTAEFTARYAGARAWRGERSDDIYVRFADVDLVSGASLAEQQTALDAGVVVFSRDTSTTAPVFIREAVSTYTNDAQSPVDGQGNKIHPVAQYKRIKNVAIQQGIELEVGDWAREGDVLGELPVNEKTRNLVLGRVQIAYQTRESAQIVQPGWSVKSAPGASDDDDFVEYLHGFHPTRSLRQMFNTARIG